MLVASTDLRKKMKLMEIVPRPLAGCLKHSVLSSLAWVWRCAVGNSHVQDVRRRLYGEHSGWIQKMHFSGLAPLTKNP